MSNSRAVAAREIDLAGAAAGHLRHLAERLLDRGQRLARIAAGAVDQAGGQPFRVVEQDLEEMLGGELLMPLAQRERLGGLDKTASAVGVFLDIHQIAPSGPSGGARMADLGRASAVPDVGKRSLGRKGAWTAISTARRRLLGHSAMAQIEAIYRYPVKGLTPRAAAPGHPVRRAPRLPLRPRLRDRERPVRLRSAQAAIFSEDPLPDADAQRAAGGAAHRRSTTTSHVLTIRYENREAARGDLRTPEGRAAIERFLAEYCADELRGPPRVLHAPGHSFSDVASKVVSIINLASVAELENAAGAPVDPLRFRGNLHVEGWPAWHEFDLLGSEIAIGPTGAAEGRQADRALRRDRGRSRNRDPRPADPARADGHLRSRRLRRLCRGDRGRRDRGRRYDRGVMKTPMHMVRCRRCR